jgi:transcriptional regulator with XRE-family HTH domain
VKARGKRSERTALSVSEALPDLLASRNPQMSVLRLAQTVGVSASHLSRALRQTDGKTVSPDLSARIAAALGKPRDYFPEYRQAVVVQALLDDQTQCDRVYDELTDRPRAS